MRHYICVYITMSCNAVIHAHHNNYNIMTCTCIYVCLVIPIVHVPDHADVNYTHTRNYS